MKPKNGLGKNKKDFNVAISHVASYLGVHQGHLEYGTSKDCWFRKERKTKEGVTLLKILNWDKWFIVYL